MSLPLVVVGAGPAGIACAVEAAARGVDVVLLEKDDDVGGTLHVSGGHLSAAGTRRQRTHGIEDDPAGHLADVERISRGTLRRDLTDLAVRLAPGVVDWLDEHGLDFAPESPRIVHGHEPYSVARTHYGVDGGRSVLEVLRPLLDEAIASGHVDLRLGVRAGRLLVSDDGSVTGVRTDAGDVHGRAVVLTTGSHAFDPATFAEVEGAPLFSAAWHTATGDGLRLARDVGAGVAGRGAHLPTFGGLASPWGDHRVRWTDYPLLTSERPPWEVYVDRAGRRFVAEDEPSIDTKERVLQAEVPDLTFWTVFDSAALAASQPMVVGWSPEDLDAQAGVRPGVHRAGSLRELAEVSGIDPDGLEATVARYNADLAAGRPDALGRQHRPAAVASPPYFSLRQHGISLIAFAGVDVDGELRVRRADGTVIPGLHAAGEVLGAAATTGNAFCGGMLLTPALAFGRLLGQTV